MVVCQGKSVLKGIAIGKIYLYEKQEYVLEQKQVADAEAEVARFEAAKETAIGQLDDLYEKALAEAGEEQAMIFDVHKMMLDDGDYLDAITGLIRSEKVNAEYAVHTTGEQFAAVFASMDDEYMKARSADVKDISGRVIRILAGIGDGSIASEEPVILLADDLTPSETVSLDKSKILAFVTRNGSANSHTAILARSMNIPALVQTDVELLKEYHGIDAVVDGLDGKLYLDPEEAVLAELVQKKEACGRERAELEKLIGLDNVTRDGRKINVYANIGSPEDVDKVLLNDAGGIGLFRSEFLYLGREDYPSEEEQFEIYKEVLSRMEGKKVIIRTLDIGADKQADYFQIPKEENPAMGYRAIRISLDRKELFVTQLRALVRASAFGKLAIMFPMITSVEQVKEIKELLNQVKADLKAEGVAFAPDFEIGIMIETPASVILSDLLAKEVDFFSVGTNDLTQYTLAVDRMNPQISSMYDPRHPAVLRMIQMAAENAKKAGIWIGICGESAGDTELTRFYVDIGINELSVTPGTVLELRRTVQQLD